MTFEKLEPWHVKNDLKSPDDETLNALMKTVMSMFSPFALDFFLGDFLNTKVSTSLTGAWSICPSLFDSPWMEAGGDFSLHHFNILCLWLKWFLSLSSKTNPCWRHAETQPPQVFYMSITERSSKPTPLEEAFSSLNTFEGRLQTAWRETCCCFT